MWDSPGALQLPSYPRLTHAETMELIARAQSGDAKARERMVESNLRLVMSVVSRFAGRAGNDSQDLFQVGCIGLVKAVERFDVSQGVRFSTYAVPLIIGEIQQYLRRDRPVKVGRSLQDLALKANRARQELSQRLGRPPTPAEIGESIGAAREEVVAALDAMQPVASLDEVVYQDDGAPIRMEDQIGDEGEAPQLLENMALRQAYDRLDPEQQLVVRLRYFEEKTQMEVARELGVSQAHISRLERRILLRLRDLLLA